MNTKVQPQDGLFVLTVLIALILFWLKIDPHGYLLYTSLALFSLLKITSLVRQRSKLNQKEVIKLAGYIFVVLLIIIHFTLSQPVMSFLAVAFIFIYATELKDQSIKLFSKS